MRKLLLASVAGLGAWGAMAVDASAQTPATYTGGVALPSASTPTPGTVVVRLNGRFRFYAFYSGDKDAENNGGSTGTLSTVTGNGTGTGGNKLATYGFAEYARLYPGFDGVAANGLKYGVSLEIRQDQASGAGGGSFGGISQQNRARSGLYFRREWGYLGTNELGTFRFGSIDQPSSLYMTGNFENFNDGGWNGDLPGLISSATQVTWPFADVGNYYTTNKIVYLSPQIFGFDAGISYEPSTANVNGSSTGCGAGSAVGTNFNNPAGSFTAASGTNSSGAATAGCDRLSSSPFNAESGRRRNTFDGLVRYRGSFGPVGVAATAGYIGGGHVLDNQTGVAFNSNPLAGTVRNNFDGLSVGDFGAAITVAGLSVGGKYQFGRMNGQWSLVPQGLPDSEAALVGASYTVGPVIVGAHYLYYKSAGDVGNAANGRIRTEQGLAAGGTYSLAPGVSIFLSYLWGQRKQNGYDFVSGSGVSTATGSAGSLAHNKVSVNTLSLGTAFSW
jgi:hypothetical protein